MLFYERERNRSNTKAGVTPEYERGERYLIVGCIVGYALAFPQGAPDSACGNHVPQHGGAPVKPNPGYSIDVSQPNNGVYTVTLSAQGNAPFSGYILQAFDSNGNSVGQFSVANSHSKVICNGAGVTHTGENPNTTTAQFLWQGGNPGARIYFRATVVVSFAEIYGDIRSAEFTV
ncbi:defense protein l(2)34Fc-like isoform X2 [Palaemon carinicauda]|uniref:defense protein l(2)34Fc-like isoform X2 n=1 Tax=Palaemon carinicauda TaxID=392227 RepID=UPI0035B66A2F